jgi:putative copper resistance protein D
MAADPVGVALILARFAHFAALAWAFGALVFPFYAGPRSQAGRGSLAAATILALLSGAAWFALTSAEMAGVPSAAWDSATLADVAGGTGFGRLWLGRMTLLALALALVLVARGRPARLAALALVAAALGSLAWTGHANDDEGALGAAHRFADVAHLLTAGLWLGALPALASELRARTQGDATAAFEVVSRFSRVAMPAVAVLVLSGAVNAALIMSSPQDLIVTDYGRLLCLKLALVAVMLGFAAANRLGPTRALRGEGAEAGMRALRRNSMIELAAGFGVLAVVAVLGNVSLN